MMDFLGWFASEKRVQAALDQSVGHDMSPTVIHMPANENEDVPFEVDIFGKKLFSVDYRRMVSGTKKDDCWEKTFVRRRS